MTVQERNPELVDLLSADFLRRGELSHTALQASMRGLPALRGLWFPGASMLETGAVIDASGQARTLTYNGNPTTNLHNSLLPYIDLDGTGDYLSRADEAGLEVSGLETYVAAGLKGLTFGGWFWFDNFTGNPSFMGKWTGTGNNRAYLLFVASANTVAVAVDSLGTGLAGFKQANSPVSVTTGAWHFIVARFVPSVSLDIYVDGVKASNTTAMVASVFATGTAIFTVGTDANATTTMDGRCAMAFLCAAALPDALLTYAYALSKPIFS